MATNDSLNEQQLRRDVHLALRAWRKLDSSPADLLSYLLVTRKYRRQHGGQQNPSTLRLATNQLLIDGIKELRRQNELGAGILELRFVEATSIRAVANRSNLSVDQINREQKRAIKQLSNILLAWEEQARDEAIHLAESRLPPSSYSRFFGREEESDLLLEQLLSDAAPWILAVVGIGGIGKTALVDATVRRLLRYFIYEEVIWLQSDSLDEHSPEQLEFEGLLESLADSLHLPPQDAPDASRLIQIRRLLKKTPYLVIIDDLETTEELSQFLARIQDLTRPTKFLITSRVRPPISNEMFVINISDLALQPAGQMLSHQAQALGIDDLAQAGGRELDRIYQAVGGNPLALKTILGLSATLPLARILYNLQVGDFSPIHVIYDRIYRRLWQMLNPNARQLLLAALLSAEPGSTLEQLGAASRLDEGSLWMAVSQLMSLCMLEHRGTAWQKRYSIQRLIRRFLQKEAVELTADSDYARAVAANLAYWHRTLDDVDGRKLGQFNPDYLNLQQAVRQGLLLPETRSQAVRLTIRLFDFIESSGRWRTWQPLVEEVIARAVEEAHTPLRCRLLVQLGHIQRMTAQPDEAVKTHREAAELAWQIGDRQRMGHARLQLAEDYRHLHRYEQAEEAALEALALFNELRSPPNWAAAALDTLGLVAQAHGRLTEAEQYLTQAVAGWRQLDEPFRLARSLNNLGLVLCDQGQHEQAAKCYHEAMDLLAETDYAVDRALLQISLGTLWFQMDRLEEAEALFQQIDRDRLQAAGHLRYQALAEQNLGIVLLDQGKLQEAVQPLQQAVELWRELGDEVMLANTLGALGELEMKQGGDGRAEPLFKEAVTLLQDYSDNPFAAKILAEFSQHLEGLGE